MSMGVSLAGSPGLAGLSLDYSWERLEPSERAVSGWACVQGLSDQGQESLKPGHRLLQGSQPRLRSLGLLLKVSVGATPPPLACGAGDRLVTAK